MLDSLSPTNSFRLGDRVVTSLGEVGQIDTIRDHMLRIRLDGGAVIMANVAEAKLIAASPFNSPRIDWRLIQLC